MSQADIDHLRRAVLATLHEHWRIIFAGLPGSAARAIGLLVGINLTFGGIALIAMALQARKIDPISAAH